MIRFIFIFLVLSFLTFIGSQYLDINFGNSNFWSLHGIFFLFFITIFPRLTLLFSSVVSGGFLWWISWLFCPRYLIAILATIAYWNTNKILVTLSWLIAIGGESSEKIVIIRKASRLKEHYTSKVECRVIE